MSYPSIADHGLIGDLQTAALVATDGTIDWFCCPRFDSPSVFASLLDDYRGGRFALAPVVPGHTTKQMYMPGTAILVTRFLSASGIAEAVDFMPIERPQMVSDRRRIVRVVRGIRGDVELEARVEPRFDYGRRSHQVHVNTTTAVFEAGPQRLHLTSLTPLERDGDDVRSRFTVAGGGHLRIRARVRCVGHAPADRGWPGHRVVPRHRGVLAALARRQLVPGPLA
jgi:hypothetical protein